MNPWDTEGKRPWRAKRAVAQGGGRASSQAFTLVELLVASVVLVMLVTVTASIFLESENVWTVVAGRTENDRAGRTALDMLTHDLECAVGNGDLSVFLGQDRYRHTAYGHSNDEMCFVAFQGDATGTPRATHAIQYWVDEMEGAVGSNRYALWRGCYALTNGADTGGVANSYWNTNWYRDPPAGAGRPPFRGVVAENVSAFRVMPTPAGGYTGVPNHVDILLEVLPERAARQVAERMEGGANGTNLLEENVKRYTTRVFFQNRHGYKDR